MESLDLMVIGGGPAGMSAALVAGRARLRTAVLNAEAPRNRVTRATHGLLTQDGTPPGELLSISRSQLEKYPSVAYHTGRATTVRHDDGAFVVESDAGTVWRARRLILATGYRDELDRLGIPGIEAVYGRSLFPCPFCDGFEHGDERLAVLGAEGVHHFVTVVRIWSDDVAVFTNGRPLPGADRDALAANGVRFYEESIEGLHHTGGSLRGIALSDGEVVARDAGFIMDDFSVPSTDFADRLGVPMTTNDWGMAVHEADDTGSTPVQGLYLVGDARRGFGGLAEAVADGARCAAGIVHEIAGERWHSGG